MYRFLLLLLLASCAPRQVKPQTILERPGWAAVEERPGVWAVLVHDAAGERAAREELCTRSYVCSVGNGGRVLIIERVRK